MPSHQLITPQDSLFIVPGATLIFLPLNGYRHDNNLSTRMHLRMLNDKNERSQCHTDGAQIVIACRTWALAIVSHK
jgi:hypothetical protein